MNHLKKLSDTTLISRRRCISVQLSENTRDNYLKNYDKTKVASLLMSNIKSNENENDTLISDTSFNTKINYLNTIMD